MSREIPSQQHSPSAVALEVWDLPLRLFHWCLVALVATAGVTGKIGGNAMDLHQQAGYGVAILVAFRLLWGFAGTRYARFGSFLRGIPSVLAYGRELFRGSAHAPGHNPLGGWMVIVLLAIAAAQAGTGLFANDDIVTEGPLFNLVSKETSDYLTGLHKLCFKALLALVGLHVSAIVLYRLVKGINLVGPMITGRMVLADPAQALRHSPGRTNLLALTLLLLVGAGFYWLVLKT